MRDIWSESDISHLFSLCDEKVIDTKYFREYLKRSLDKGSISGLSYLECLNRLDEYDQRKEDSNVKETSKEVL